MPLRFTVGYVKRPFAQPLSRDRIERKDSVFLKVMRKEGEIWTPVCGSHIIAPGPEIPANKFVDCRCRDVD
jgi:hypothetical protein